VEVTERKPFYRPEDWKGGGGAGRPERELGEPGAFPFTRGIHPTMYRGKLWTMRQYAGFGTAEDTNARFRHLLAAGQTGLSVAFDLPTQMGYDSDHPVAEGEVGRVGVAIDTVDDLQRLFQAIPLDRVSTSMTINATAAILLAMYVVAGEEQGVSRERLQGTIQNDILKEYIARGTYIFPPAPSLRLVADTFRFTAEQTPRFNPISVSGYHMREAGATAVQEVAFTFANGLEYVRRAESAGLEVDAFAPRLSFFFAAYTDLFEEVAKFRAARRLWARLMKERFGANDTACRLRFHTQTGGATLTAQQPMNNVVRVALQALAAVCGGTQSLHTNAMDEALGLPTERAARLALRTQQVIAHESGVARVADPLGGAWAIEAATVRLVDEVRDYIRRIGELGGAMQALAAGFQQREIADAAYAHQKSVESGRVKVVGVNVYREDDGASNEALAVDPGAERRQIERLQALRARRDAARAAASLEALGAAARQRRNLMPPILDCVRAEATLGEIAGALRAVYGEWSEAEIKL
jgi:methylmalonyl-CoA mutase N-terminal domain/subunit